MEIIIITPEYAETKGPKDLSSEIIQKLTIGEKIILIGIGSSIPLTLSGINLSRNIANVNVLSVSLDYISVQLFGKQEAIFIELGQDKEKTSKIISKFEKMEDAEKRFRTIWVSKREGIADITNEILFKLSKNDIVKILASGFTIYFAIKSVLQVVKTGISRDKIGIEDIIIDSIIRKDDTTRVPAIAIYIIKGEVKPPEYIEAIKKQILKRD